MTRDGALASESVVTVRRGKSSIRQDKIGAVARIHSNAIFPRSLPARFRVHLVA